MKRRQLLSLMLLLVLPMPFAPRPTSAQESSAGLEHDLENGCGKAGQDFVPDNSSVIRAIFLDVHALPELVAWAIDTDAVDYFTGSCNVHDRCYGTYGTAKGDCDWAFFLDLAAACYQAYQQPEAPGWWDWGIAPLTGGIPPVWTATTLWRAAEYGPCVTQAATAMSGAVWLFADDAYEKAQDDALRAAKCWGLNPQSSYTGIHLPRAGIELAWNEGCSVTDVAYGQGRWSGISRDITAGAQTIYWLGDPTEVQETWAAEAEDGKWLTSLEYGEGTWVAVFTDGTGINRQVFSNRGAFADMQRDIRSAWDQGLAVTELEYGDGRWMMFASDGTEISNQEWERGIRSNDALFATIESHGDEGWYATNIEYADGEWFVVFSQGMDEDWGGWGVFYRSSYHDLRVALDDHASAGQFALDAEFGAGSWWALWYEPPLEVTAPPATTPPTQAPPEPPAFVAVPDVEGGSTSQARSILEAAGFEVRFADRPVEDVGDAGRVVDQDPDAGSLRLEGSTVTVYVGDYTEAEPAVISTPDVYGQTTSSARSEIEGLGLIYSYGGTMPVTDPALDGRVADQLPAAGTAVFEGDTVTVYVGDYEPPLVTVPDLGGLTESVAISTTEGAGLVPRRAGTIETSDSGSYGRVMDQDPLPYGPDVPAGSIVDYWIGVEDPGSEIGDGPGGSSLDPSADGDVEIFLTSGFTPDPDLTQFLFFGGSTAIDVSYLGSPCVGFADPSPTVEFHWSGGGSLLRFFFIGSGNADTTMVVRAPSGSWYCADDWEDTNDPAVTFTNPQSGEYSIWIGSYSQGGSGSGDFYVTEVNQYTP